MNDDARRIFGERLRRHRERLHVTLESIADTTKVAASLFAGLECGDCRRWPAGFYGRSFIRGYATAIQLDPDDIAAEFARLYEAPDAAVPAPAAADGFRLTLDPDPAGPWIDVARRAALALRDLAIVLACAAAVALVTGHFWLCLAVASLLHHAGTRLLAGTSPLELARAFDRRRRRTAPADAAIDETPHNGTASIA